MHIVLGILGSIITILILLNRLAEAGVDLGGLNPFLWNKRRKWKKKYDGNPIFKIDNPMDATAILMVAIAKADGDMTKEDKTQLLDLFQSEFHLSSKDAAGLLISSVHLLGDGSEVEGKIPKFLAPSKASFSKRQTESALFLISKVTGDLDKAHANVKDMVQSIQTELTPQPLEQEAWD